MITTITYGILIFAFLYIFVSLQDAEGKHQILRVFSFFIAVYFMFLLATSSMISASNNCEWLLNDTQEIYVYGNNFTNGSYHWDYDDPKQVYFNDQAFVFHKNITNNYALFCNNYMLGNTTLLIKTLPIFFVFLTFYWLFLAFGLLWKKYKKSKEQKR